MKRILIAFLAIILLSSCSARWHVKKAMKLDPSIFVTKIDTIRDTVYIEVASIDTVFKYNMDTVEFWRDSVYIKYHYSYEDSLVYIEVDCPDNETITITNTITETITLKPTFLEKVQWFGYAVIAILLFMVVKRFI